MILRLPVPPSVNAMFANSPNARGRGRFKTGRYKEWVKLADAFLCPPVGPEHVETIDGPYSLEIRLPQRVRGDLDNRVKAIADFLVSRGVTPDDKHMDLLTVRRCPELDGLDCWVVVEMMANTAQPTKADLSAAEARPVAQNGKQTIPGAVVP